MAPEQIQGGHVDERTDIYSLGIIMYEMLAGKVPFERATSVNILMAHVGEPPPPMREVNPNLVCSPAFEELVMCCIAKDPNQRLGSMDMVLQAIRRAHGGSMTGQLSAITAGYTPPGGATSVPQVRYPAQTPGPYGMPRTPSVQVRAVDPLVSGSAPHARASLNVPAVLSASGGYPVLASGDYRADTTRDFGGAFVDTTNPRARGAPIR